MQSTLILLNIFGPIPANVCVLVSCFLPKLDEELEALMENGDGLYDEKEVVALCRLMVRVETMEQKLTCLKLIQVRIHSCQCIKYRLMICLFCLVVRFGLPVERFVVILNYCKKYLFALHRILRARHA